MDSSTVVVVQRAEDYHVSALSDLIRVAEASGTALGGKNIRADMDRCVLSLTALAVSADSKVPPRVVGFASFSDAPTVEGVPRASWESWLTSAFNVSPVLERPGYVAAGLAPYNTMWLTSFVSHSDYQFEVLSMLFEAAFGNMPDIDQFLLAAPREPKDPLLSAFSPLDARSRSTGTSGGPPPLKVSVLWAGREAHLPKLSIREARVEDNDDLVPICNAQSELLSARYGEYFLSSLIESQDDENVAIVAEVNGLAVGLMALCADVALDALNECFELEPFGGLIQPPGGAPVWTEDDDEALAASRSGLEPSPSAMWGQSGGASAVDAADAAAAAAAAAAAEVTSVAAAAAAAAKDPDFLAIAVDLDAGAAGPLGASASVGAAATGAAMSASAARPASASSSASSSGSSGSTSSSSPSSSSAGQKHRHSHHHHRHGHGADHAAVPSAVAMTLFVLDERYETRGLDFLSAIFSYFPDRDYLILTLPRTTPQFALLDHFQAVQQRPGSAFPHVLYLLHRASLHAELSVRRLRTSDEAAAIALLDGVDGATDILQRVGAILRLEREETLQRHTFETLTERAFAVVCTHQLVGLLLVSSAVETKALRQAFDVNAHLDADSHRTADHAILTDAVLSPVFLPCGRLVLRETLRAAGRTVLYKQVFRGQLVPPLLDEFVQVRPRRAQPFPEPIATEVYGVEGAAALAAGHSHPYALFLHATKHAYERRIVVNALIVVVGASETGLATLESLLFTRHLRFTNLVLVSPHGLPTLEAAAMEGFLPVPCSYSARLLLQLGLEVSVRIVRARVALIDRQARALLLTDGAVLPFDAALVVTGRQMTVPQSLLAATDSESGSEAGRSGGRAAGLLAGGGASGGGGGDFLLEPSLLTGVHAVNSEFDVPPLMAAIQSALIARRERVVVYGATLEAYALLHGLLAAGVPPGQITHVLPASRSLDLSCFNEFAVDEHVAAAVQTLGIRVIHDLELVAINRGGDRLASITLAAHRAGEDDSMGSATGGGTGVGSSGVDSAAAATGGELTQLPCGLLLWAHTRAVDPLIFSALNSCSLVYDGALVVDTRYTTVERTVFAAGPLTKFSRRFASDLDGVAFNSVEAGGLLAKAVLADHDPLAERPEDGAPPPPLPIYTMPVAVTAMLPGGARYVHFEGPKRLQPMAKALAAPGYGADMVTNGASGYARLHIDKLGRVEALTYLGAGKGVEPSNLLQLYGLPVSYLHGLEARVASGDITDLIAFFQEPWVQALFHDRFVGLRAQIGGILESTDPMAFAVEKLVAWREEGVTTLTPQHMEILRAELSGPETQSAVLAATLEYLHRNTDMLPMYHVPGSHFVSTGRFDPV